MENIIGTHKKGPRVPLIRLTEYLRKSSLNTPLQEPRWFSQGRLFFTIVIHTCYFSWFFFSPRSLKLGGDDVKRLRVYEESIGVPFFMSEANNCEAEGVWGMQSERGKGF